MNGRILNLKETAPCGIVIRYEVDSATDFVTYTDINGRGEGRKSDICEKCSWRGICKPTTPGADRLFPAWKKVKIDAEMVLSPEQIEILYASYTKAIEDGCPDEGFEPYINALARNAIGLNLMSLARFSL